MFEYGQWFFLIGAINIKNDFAPEESSEMTCSKVSEA